MSNTTSTNTLEVSRLNDTDYSEIYGNVYSGTLNSTATVANDKEVLAIYNSTGNISYLLFDSTNETEYVKTKLKEGYIDEYQNQESDFKRVLAFNTSLSKVNPSLLMSLFGSVNVDVVNQTEINTHYSFGKDCNSNAPKDQCCATIVSPDAFTNTRRNYITYSQDGGCRRVVALYLKSKENDSVNGTAITDDQIKLLEDPCGRDIICSDDNVTVYFRHSTNKINTFFLLDGHLRCLVYQNQPDYNDLSVERVIYEDKDCADFENNYCLHRGSNVGEYILQGSDIITNTETTNKYIEKYCPNPICGPEYCSVTSINSKPTNSTLDNSEQCSLTRMSIFIASLTVAVCILLAIISSIIKFKRHGFLNFEFRIKRLLKLNISIVHKKEDSNNL